jgi:hypothetical protein
VYSIHFILPASLTAASSHPCVEQPLTSVTNSSWKDIQDLFLVKEIDKNYTYTLFDFIYMRYPYISTVNLLKLNTLPQTSFVADTCFLQDCIHIGDTQPCVLSIQKELREYVWYFGVLVVGGKCNKTPIPLLQYSLLLCSCWPHPIDE